MEIPSKANFPRAREVAYLDTAAEGLPPEQGCEALAQYYRHKASGSPGRRQLYVTQTEAIVAAAGLLNTAPRHVALLSSTSERLNLLVNSIDWRAGDEAWIPHGEILAAIKARKPTPASKAIAAHIDNSRERMLKLFGT